MFKWLKQRRDKKAAAARSKNSFTAVRSEAKPINQAHQAVGHGKRRGNAAGGQNRSVTQPANSVWRDDEMMTQDQLLDLESRLYISNVVSIEPESESSPHWHRQDYRTDDTPTTSGHTSNCHQHHDTGPSYHHHSHHDNGGGYSSSDNNSYDSGSSSYDSSDCDSGPSGSWD